MRGTNTVSRLRGQNHISVTLFSGWFHPTAQGRIPLGAPNPYPQGAGLGFAQYDAAMSKPIPGTTGGHRGQGVPGEWGVPALSRAPQLPGAGSELLVLTPHHSLLPLQLSPSLPKTPGKAGGSDGWGGGIEAGGGPNVLSPKETFSAQVAYMKNLREGASLSYWRNITAKCFRGCFTSLIVKKLKR